MKLERLELALRASNEGIWDWQTDKRNIYYSRRILEFLECGKDRAPNLFLPPFETIHPEEKESFIRGVTQALQDGGPETLAVDARVRTGGGDWRWLKIRGTVVRDRDGKTLADRRLDDRHQPAQSRRGAGRGGTVPASPVDRPHPGADLFQGSGIEIHHGQSRHGGMDGTRRQHRAHRQT